MTAPTITASQVRRALLLRNEIALLDVRHEAAYATGHPLFAANMATERIALEAGTRLPRKDVPVVVYDAGEGLIPQAVDRLTALGYTDVRQLDGGLEAWQRAGFELFREVTAVGVWPIRTFGGENNWREKGWRAGGRHAGLEVSMAVAGQTRRTRERFGVCNAVVDASGDAGGVRLLAGGHLVHAEGNERG